MLPFEDRYTRQRQLPEVGAAGQDKIAQGRVVTRQPVAAEYLFRAGVGTVQLETAQGLVTIKRLGDAANRVGPPGARQQAPAPLRTRSTSDLASFPAPLSGAAVDGVVLHPAAWVFATAALEALASLRELLKPTAAACAPRPSSEPKND